MGKRNQYLHTKLAFDIYKKDKICETCKSTENICVHHIDENPGNNQESNLQILCNSCHRRHHTIGNTYMLGKKLSEHTRKKMSISQKGLNNRKGTGKLINGLGVIEWKQLTGKSQNLFYKLAK